MAISKRNSDNGIPKFREKENCATKDLLKYILRKHVPRLDFYVGTRYRDLDTRCSVGEVGLDMEDSDESGIMPADFEATETVEEKLANCIV